MRSAGQSNPSQRHAEKIFTGAPRLVGVLLCWAMSLFVANEALASDSERLLDQRVHAFLVEHTRELGRDVEINIHPGAARLGECRDPQPFLTNPEQRLYGRVSVGVRCDSKTSQTRYLQAEVSVLVDHVVTARDIEAGSRIGPADVKLVEGRLERLPRHALLDIDDALGLSAARPLRAGSLLQTHHLRRERLVTRGSKVTVLARGNGFSVRREAKALDHGSLGEAVRLSIEGGDHLRAIVTGRGRLEVAF
ncbi:flagellar basal body P-ring formation chaperone FlgA [Halomonas sp. GXIMD04776]|uniref:flagellar basal body P-ring formation chaperone FlgA n=1 Tax=Halomonas sp. GXIMD04776 TaxID=3415605 RepID=UPI003CB74109